MVRLVGHTLTSRPPRGLSARAPDNTKRPTTRVPSVFVKVPLFEVRRLASSAGKITRLAPLAWPSCHYLHNWERGGVIRSISSFFMAYHLAFGNSIRHVCTEELRR